MNLDPVRPFVGHADDFDVVPYLRRLLPGAFVLTSDPSVIYSCRMPTRERDREKAALLQGTLDLLILRTLVFGPQHGQGIARAIQRQSDQVFIVDHGSLYLALQRLEDREWVSAKWGVSTTNRRARFYTLTAKGRAHMVRRTDRWRRVAAAMTRILGPDKAEV